MSASNSHQRIGSLPTYRPRVPPKDSTTTANNNPVQSSTSTSIPDTSRPTTTAAAPHRPPYAASSPSSTASPTSSPSTALPSHLTAIAIPPPPPSPAASPYPPSAHVPTSAGGSDRRRLPLLPVAALQPKAITRSWLWATLLVAGAVVLAATAIAAAIVVTSNNNKNKSNNPATAVTTTATPAAGTQTVGPLQPPSPTTAAATVPDRFLVRLAGTEMCLSGQVPSLVACSSATGTAAAGGGEQVFARSGRAAWRHEATGGCLSLVNTDYLSFDPCNSANAFQAITYGADGTIKAYGNSCVAASLAPFGNCARFDLLPVE
ncbi:hypothetical protein DFJ73DRAFT_780754 [Zopfochytrium polystomum]|nr:hypothetical protein DFJ73DRAFT_780754 [Zopfochytrium polystomum]